MPKAKKQPNQAVAPTPFWQKKWVGWLCAALFWLAVWLIGCAATGSALLLPTPWQTLKAFGALAVQADFWLAVAGSLGRILLGFCGGLILGVALAFLCRKFVLAKRIVAPAIGVCKAAPVASFIILANLWLKSGTLTAVIAGLMVLPLCWRSTLEGLEAMDAKMSQMADAFCFSAWRKLRLLTLPALMPALRSALTVGMGFAWKAGVAAEVIVLVEHSVGEGLYNAKVGLETPTLFAYTALTVCVSLLLEKLLLWLLAFKKPMPSALPLVQSAKSTGQTEQTPLSHPTPIGLQNVTFFYEQAKPVLQNRTLVVQSHGVTQLQGPSGSGKTTTLLLLGGLLCPQKGQVQFWQKGSPKAAMVFQEDRLIGHKTVLENLLAVAPKGTKASGQVLWQAAADLLASMGLEDALSLPACECSGGMARRVALARGVFFARFYPGLPLLLDEPFSGVDEQTKQQIYPILLKEAARRPVLLVTHLEAEAKALEAKKAE